MRKKYSIDLAAQMAECEANYARIMRLLPDMENIDSREFGVDMPGSAPAQLRIAVTERCKYTTMLDVCQETVPAVAGVLPEPLSEAPVFSLRVYHDVQMAEVVGFNHHRRIQPQYDYPNENMYQRDEKVQLNRFLGEWLSHCLKYGHALGNPARQAFSTV